MAANTAFVLSTASQKAFIAYYREITLTVTDTVVSQRARFEEIDRTYQSEKDYSDEQAQSKKANRAGNTKPLQNVTIPVVMPQVESAVVYQSSVFLTGHPLLGVVSGADFIDEALQMETVIEENSVRGGWTKQFMKFFRHGAKYNFAPVEISWESEITPAIETDIQFSSKQGKPIDVVWSGNALTSLDPYNTFVDPTVEPSEVYKDGEYAGFTEYKSRIALKVLISKLSSSLVQNVTKAFESPSAGNPANNNIDTAERFYVPAINPEVNENDAYEESMNWNSWAGLDKKAGNNKAIQYKNSYEVTTLYCKILPSEFSLRVPAANTPQIWKLIIVNHEVIIFAERQTNAHGYIPILIGAPQEDGLGLQTKSLATNAKPFQEVATSHMASIIASRRRAISDRVIYDPSRILAAHMNSENPSAKIPVKPSAYGKNISDAVYQFPYREDQAANDMAQIREVVSMANVLSGQNQTRQGQFVKGNKTRAEFETTLNNANGRDQMVAILTEVQVFTPLKHILKLNILQFQGGTTLYSEEQAKQVDIDPVKLRSAVMNFKISDGLIPSDKLINAEAFGTALQTVASSPAIGGSYNIGPMFSYLMKTQGANIKPFEKSPEQVAYEQALGAWQQMGATLIDKGGDISELPPQPVPQDFGYDPSGGAKASEQQQGDPSSAGVPASSQN